MPGPDIDFARIRPYGQPASRSSAFEELASILIKGGSEWPEGTRFFRFGNPDGGREGKGVLPSGDVWAWQAKYLFEFDSSAASQVGSSILRVLEFESNLKRYYVALPIDLPAGDTETRTSAYTRWTEKVVEWKELASRNGLDVEFVFVGAHDLAGALTETRHEGRARYWFATDILTPEWQSRRLEEAIAKAGRRYTPRLHIDVETRHALDAVGRSDVYVARWQSALAELRSARRWGWQAPPEAAAAFGHELPRSVAALDQADATLESMISAAHSTDGFPTLEDSLSDAAEAMRTLDGLLHEHCLTDDRYFVGDAASLYSRIRDARGALRQALRLARSSLTRAASEKLLVVIGRAGVGKTHLLCDVAVKRVSDGQPTILLLGQDFDRRSLLAQIGELTQLGRSTEEVFALLDAAAQAAGCIGLFMIDALNESEQAERWRDELRVLAEVADRHPRVALVVTCRTEFVESVLGDEDLPTVEHPGFAEATDAAVRRFTQDYGLEEPTFPVLNPEFGNPLFLKLTCDALATLGETRFPFGTAGLLTVCDAFLEAVNARLSEPARSDYDKRTDPVGRAARELALRGPVLDRDEVREVTESALPGREWSRSLMRGLINEGVLIELGDGRIVFGYQRLGDVLRATEIASGGRDAVRNWLDDVGEDRWREQGVLDVLAVIVPEQLGMEFFELAADEKGEVSYDIVDGFLESLLLRSPDHVTAQAVDAVRRLLDDQYDVTEIWDRLLRIACVPGHSLNAEWLHSHLMALDVAERDATWSTWLVGSVDTDENSAVRRLIEWAWPVDLQSREFVPDDVAALATQVLGWLLTTSDRRVRDSATKAIVSIAERAPHGFIRTLRTFRGTNDPYVVERLAAAACALVLRTTDPGCVCTIADGVTALIADGWPEHLLTRDFVRRVYEAASASGWAGPSGRPPYGTRWPVPTLSIGEIEAVAGPPDYAYGSIWHSLAGMGDFGRYVLRSALESVVSGDDQALKHDVERAVFNRVLQLGWTPDRFSGIDRGRSGGWDGVVERVGKKYQWIAFYETLGRIADNLPIKRSLGDSTPVQYEYAEQLVWRDIDPTVLVRKPAQRLHPDPLWFAPAVASFPDSVTDQYPTDMTGVPDPLDLMAVVDPDRVSWLVLVANHSWVQPLPPEVVALETPRLAVWMQLHAYLVPTAEVDALTEWARDKDWSGHWMPQVAEPHNVLLGSHPHDPNWQGVEGAVDWWDGRAGGPQPAELGQCAVWYGGTGTSLDASAEEETRGYAPTRPLLDALGVSSGVDFRWDNASGLAVHDPSVCLGGPGALVMRRDLVPVLHASGTTVFWTVLVGNELHRRHHIPTGDDYRWVSASASYILNDERIERVHALASRCRPGPTTEHRIDWVTRLTEP